MIKIYGLRGTVQRSPMPPESKLEKAERYVREGEAHVASQAEIVAGLKASRRGAREAQALLAIFRDSLEEHRLSLAKLKAKS
jgi:hypothetical protein